MANPARGGAKLRSDAFYKYPVELAHRRDEKVLLFLTDLFFGRQGPVRRFDRKPVGSPVHS